MDGGYFLDQLHAVFSGEVFLSATCSWLASQVIKVAIACRRSAIRSVHGFFDFAVWRTGGMPSSHSALVSALTLSFALKCGLHSDLFIFSFFSAIIVVRDALGVRRSSGLQAEALNSLGARVSEKLDFSFRPVREIHGHKPLEVVVGVAVGIVTSALFYSSMSP